MYYKNKIKMKTILITLTTLALLTSCKKKEEIKPSEYVFEYQMVITNYTIEELKAKNIPVLEVLRKNGEKITNTVTTSNGTISYAKNVKVKDGDELVYQGSIPSTITPRPVFYLVFKNLTLGKEEIRVYGDTTSTNNNAILNYKVKI